MNYKDHQIEVSFRAVDDPKGWTPDIFVSYSEHGKSLLQCPRINQTFATRAEAEKAGIEFAQKWIASRTSTYDTQKRDRVTDE
jgi:hypothetical protein